LQEQETLERIFKDGRPSSENRPDKLQHANLPMIKILYVTEKESEQNLRRD